MRRLAVAAGAVALGVALGTVAVAAPASSPAPAPSPSLPTDTQHEVQADMPIPVPSTHSCTVTLMTHDFKSSYGAPYVGGYVPPSACPGPWAKVVLTFTGTVAGTQFDRDLYIAIGHAVVLDGTTSEPCCTGNATTWTVQRDITAITPLLRRNQPVVVELDNVNDSTYTGVYHSTLTLTFYATAAHVPAGPHPDVVLPISSTSKGGPMLSISKDKQLVGQPVVFPRNLTKLVAEVFADAHGPFEEFWWDDPSNGAGQPYRELDIYIDGKLAGAAPAYPAIYTGDTGPGLWEPIPAPRAWNLRPYNLDLTPFVGLLTNGKPHAIQLGVGGTQFASGDFWMMAANLQGWIAPGVARTTGHLRKWQVVQNWLPASSDPTGQGVPYTVSGTHPLTFVGDVTVAGKTTTTTVDESMGESGDQAVVLDNGTWTWNRSTTTQQGNHTTVFSESSTWTLLTDELTTYQLGDSGTSTTTVDGTRTGWTSYAETMRTADATGLIFNGFEHEEYGYSDNTGTCYDHQLSSQAGEVTVDVTDSLCPSEPS